MPPRPTTTDRLLPHSTEAERGLIGPVLAYGPVEAKKLMVTLAPMVKVDHHYSPANQEIWYELLEMHDANKDIDIVTLRQRLSDRGALDDVGGMDYLNGLCDAGIPSMVSDYATILKEKWGLRRIIRECAEITSEAFNTEDNKPEEIFDRAETRILGIRQGYTVGGYKKAKEFTRRAITMIQETCERKGGVTGISTGFADLDKMTGGLHGGEMIVIAARPGLGKTSIAMNIAENVCIGQKEPLPVGVFSMEMTTESLVLRLLCSRSKVNLRLMQNSGMLPPGSDARIVAAGTEINKAPLFIDDASGLSIADLRARARRMYQEQGIKLFVVDYLQLMHSTNDRVDTRQQEVADISSGIKNLAKELNVPIIALCQLNRELERRKGKPVLSDLRESGSIEQDADVVGMLYNKDEKEPTPDQMVMSVGMNIAKQRNGPTGDVDFTFMRSYTRFENAAKPSPIDDEDVPNRK
jgi:replicative DNA helicase